MSWLIIHKSRTDDVHLFVGELADAKRTEGIKLNTKQFRALCRQLKKYDSDKYDRESLILVKDKL